MKRFAVIGLGNFGFYAAKALFEDGNEAVAIDTDKAKVQAIDPHSTEAVVLDATDKEALKALGLENMDGVIVSTGTKISISILICLYLQEIGVGKIEVVPENFVLVPPANFVIKDSDILIMLGKSEDIRRIKALKQCLIPSPFFIFRSDQSTGSPTF